MWVKYGPLTRHTPAPPGGHPRIQGLSSVVPKTPAAPRVAFIIPCFNHGQFVEEAVRSALAQEAADVRVIVVNDGSSDGVTPAACDRCRLAEPADGPHRVHVVHQVNAGLPAARNAGVRAADAFAPEHDLYVFLDADDYVEPSFVRKLCAKLDVSEGSNISHAYCQERLIGLGSGIWNVPDWDPLLLAVTNLRPVTCVVRRDRFREVGGFDESMRLGYEDWDLWMRFADRGWRGVRVTEPLFVWRRHSATTMITDAVSRHDELYGALVARHGDFFRSHAMDIIRLSNGLLRSGDAHWIDENRRSILLGQLRSHVQDVYNECFTLREQSSRDRAARVAAEKSLAESLSNAEASVARLRAEYESKAAVRLSRRVFRVIDALPRPLASPVRAGLRLVKRFAGSTPATLG